MYSWHILTIGHLSRNKFWGEKEDTTYRRPLATCTLISGHGEHIVVDPSLPPEAMAEALLAGSGLHPEQITRVYTTHYHYDHHVSPETFPNAKWTMPAKELAFLQNRWDEYIKMWPVDSREIVDRYEAAGETLCEGINVIPVPGHTEGISALAFTAPEGRVLVTGDAVMTKEFYRAGESYFFGWDIEKGTESIKSLRGKADVIIPGH
ncbi:MBL fold metallo-hydrolase, partial [Eubacteriales bacterium OttesenSCG-928-A19]|nr:MBL fold metallo-hydrolase [Eubacteriales bacterium OttesenSCG-928-A19]